MEIANTKQQKDTKENGPSQKAETSSSGSLGSEIDGIQAEIDALYRSVPEVASHFIITDKIGEGAFSCVYLAKLKHHPEVTEMFALKHILPTTHPSRIENELRCLLKLGGQDNVMGCKLCLRNKDNVVIVMQYFPHDKFNSCVTQMCVSEVWDYMRNLLVALARVHRYNVIHRDVKPSNFLYNRKRKQFALVDFGLASGSFLIDRDSQKHGKRGHTEAKIVSPPGFADSRKRLPLSPSKINVSVPRRASTLLTRPGVTPPVKRASITSPVGDSCQCFGEPKICSLCAARRNELAPRAGTSGFRAPEVLMKSASQSTAVDVWSAGTIFLSLLSARYPFFRAQEDTQHLAQIIALLGTDALVEAAHSFGKTLTVSEHHPPLDLQTMCYNLRAHQKGNVMWDQGDIDGELSQSYLSPHAYDLLARMLDPNPATRISAAEALQHPFFTDRKALSDDVSICDS